MIVIAVFDKAKVVKGIFEEIIGDRILVQQRADRKRGKAIDWGRMRRKCICTKERD